MAHYLATASAADIEAAGSRRLLAAFHRAARTVPAYRRILREAGVDARRIATVEDFRREVPIVDKQAIFAANDLRDLCAGGDLRDIALFYSSSGHSGVFSFGVETRADAGRTALGVEFALQNNFHVLDRKTLLINCNAMGVKIHTRTLALAETSVREDVIWALVRELRDDFDQFLLIGEHPFLKKVIEEGPDHGVPWKDLVVHVVTGAEYIAENFRTYLASLLGVDFDRPDDGMIGVNFGLSELSVSLFTENIHTLRIRRLAQADGQFRKALYGRETTICPNVMQYYPHQTFIETVAGPDGRSQLVVSMLDPALKLPLIRYNTGDVVETMAYDDLARILRESGQPSLVPAFHLPVGIIWGRFQGVGAAGDRAVYPEQVKEALYADAALAGEVTGNFRIEPGEGEPRLLVQLRKGRPPRQEQSRTLARHLADYGVADVPVAFLPYEAFPYGLEHDYERKNQYLSRQAVSTARSTASGGPAASSSPGRPS